MWQYNYLQHYASKYYDPVKAHEYYEKHKQLKGRTSRPSLNEEGKKVAAVVKENVNEEKNTKLNEEAERYKKEQELRRDATKRTMEQHRKIMNQRIESLRNSIKRMPDSMKYSEAPKIKAMIKKLVEDNDKKRKSLQEKYASDSKKASEETYNKRSSINQEYDNIYETEYNKIASEEQYKGKR